MMEDVSHAPMRGPAKDELFDRTLGFLKGGM
jgi:hypothetical protein